MEPHLAENVGIRRDLNPRYRRERANRAFFRPAWNLSEIPRSMKLRDRPWQIRLKSEGFVHAVFLILSNLKATALGRENAGYLRKLTLSTHAGGGMNGNFNALQ